MPIWIFEIGIIVWAGWICFRLFRNGLTGNILELSARLIGIAASTLTYYIVWQVLGRVTANFFVHFAVAALIAFAAYVLLCHFLFRWIHYDQGALIGRINRKLRIGSRMDYAAGILCCLGFLALFVLALDFVSQVVFHSQWYEEVKSNSLLLTVFLPTDAEQTREQKEDEITRANAGDYNSFNDAHLQTMSDDAMTVPEAEQLQRDLFARFRSHMKQSREYIYDSTGVGPYVDQIKAMQEIINLSEEQKEWVMMHNPEIMQLIEHSAIIRIAENDRIHRLIERIGEGSISAIYELGDEPDIQHLLADATIQAVIRKIDLVKLVKQAKERPPTHSR